MTLHDDYLSRLAPWSDIQMQMPLLHEIAGRYPQVKVLELGVRSGNSTAAFLAAAQQAGGHVWSVDIELPGVPGDWETSGTWTFHHGDDLGDLPEEFTALEPDVLFIDTSHEFGCTVAELRRFVPMVAAGGVVLMHDTLLTWDHPEYQVAAALDAFCAESGCSWSELSVPPYGLGQILIPGDKAAGA